MLSMSNGAGSSAGETAGVQQLALPIPHRRRGTAFRVLMILLERMNQIVYDETPFVKPVECLFHCR